MKQELKALSQLTNRSEAQTNFLYELSGNDFSRLLKYEAHQKQSHKYATAGDKSAFDDAVFTWELKNPVV